MTTLPLTGGCGCGAVRYEISELPAGASYCHCTRCQRRSGTAASASAAVVPGSFSVVSGDELIRFWSPEGGFEKAFCSRCGSALFSRDPANPDRVGVRLGTFDGDPGVRPGHRQYTNSAAVWEPIPDDGLRRFPEHRSQPDELPTMPDVPEAPLAAGEHGLEPQAPGWFVLNAREAPWVLRDGRGAFAEFEGFDDKSDFTQVGVNVQVLGPGEVMAMYHWERDQEDFLVISGEAILICEGEERPLRAWDLAHCPPGAKHVIVGAGDGPCVVVAIGARQMTTGSDWGGYPPEPAAAAHGASVEVATSKPAEAYARFAERKRSRYVEGLLP